MSISKVVENRLRRVARRQGYTLVKSRVRDARDKSFGLYRLDGVRGEGRWLSPAAIARKLREPLEGGPPEHYATGFYREGQD